MRLNKDHPLKEWTNHIDEWLAELIRLEGRGSFASETCAGCLSTETLYRCEDCCDLQLFCRDCTVSRHQCNPFHRVEGWANRRFQKTTLKALGLRIQLGHAVGERCANPWRAFGDDFTVLDIGGIHEVALDYCSCEHAEAKHIQLLRFRLFPATGVDPKTACTFKLMELFHLLRNQTKVSGFEFYNSLARLTDNTGTVDVKSRYTSFMRMARMWMHLKMLKRFGRGHDPKGVNATACGSCAVLCPACPHPGINLPENWKDAPPEKSWLYRLFLGIDANFRLKRKEVSTDVADPGLNHGYAYFVEEKAYKSHLQIHGKVEQKDVNTCNNHDAVKLANMRGIQGIAASGVGTVECVRHDMKRPCSVGDLQKGERYVNMDYLFASSVRQQGDKMALVVSYDIACQWSVNLWERMLQYDPEWDFDRQTITFLIPKFHLPAHQASCQTQYSYNYRKHVGRTDGEAVERGWAAVNGFSGSTKEMGPGYRRDVLDDAFGDYNWRKVTQLGKTLLEKVKNAVDERSTHVLQFEEICKNTDPVRVAEWTQLVEAWENGAEYDPLAVHRHPVTVASVRRALAEEDAAAQADDRSTTMLHEDVSPSVLIIAGLEIEELQRRLRKDALNLSSTATDLQQAAIIRRRSSLQLRIDAWREFQVLYMPAVALLRSKEASKSSKPVNAEDTPLYLPSDIINTDTAARNANLESIELRLRYAQANDALEQMRRHLRARSKLYNVKDRDVRGQRYNTRSRTYINTVQDKIDADAARYRAAHTALLVLDPKDTLAWMKVLRYLGPEDVRGMKERLEKESEGKRVLPWIWRTTGFCGGDDEDEDDLEAVRIEWCQARARAHRFNEECDLLEEEMRRVVDFWNWQAWWWLHKADEAVWDASTSPVGCSPQHAEGRLAYARRQADIRLAMMTKVAKNWQCVPECLDSGAKL
ncbi:uncharacterized protein C8Q71DRAFT_718824 [Rhodofomes roseus]|uniref:CxC2-like cysteine cluster KDZ transposase-associated domain-containing protein n=1 Tax=Rhodofomes roseus TaxID=34475 RepID=A0ABQ8JYB5_9APHY|nr:uncharacterized protein C8Q71DRAFT_718824 [Rhodofomes roseus]KAH9828984.1 hypothetical protein C8Q71DRAFT_718824 [Rhodofomes roseus]